MSDIAIVRTHRWLEPIGCLRSSSLTHLSDRVGQLANELKLTAVVIAHDDGAIMEWGDTRRPVNVRSIRKSLISALYGSAVDRTIIDLNVSLGELGIGGLTQTESRATIRDLLMSRSGIYRPAAYEPPSMKAKRPARGSHSPGTRWFYNNWDFNALGTIYERMTGEDVFAGFERQFASQIGMADFARENCRLVFDPSAEHPAHLFRLSALDLARIGTLFLRHGFYSGRRLLSDAWITASTRYLSSTDQGRLEYGYLWWIASAGAMTGSRSLFCIGYGRPSACSDASSRTGCCSTRRRRRRAGKARFQSLRGSSQTDRQPRN
jgi:CubicO group peptidase (beta-lactamase class C family)